MKFDIVLHGENYEGVLIKTFESEALPRIGENVDIFGEDLEVDLEVKHVIHDLSEGVIEVWLGDELPTWMLCDAYLFSCRGWRFDGFGEKDIKDFEEALKNRKQDKG